MFDGHIQVGSRQPGYLAGALLLVALALAGYLSAHHMDVSGHWITGMNNQVVWGLPHVFAITLIVGASGALNVASLGSVFGNAAFKPWARLSGALAISLLAGGLLVLVLDLGRPERLVVAMTHYNFKSIFAWNIFLYTGFMALAVAYLFTLFERQAAGWSGRLGIAAFAWRFVLTSGTGAIFGFLVARPFYDAAMLIPLFIALSLVLGTAAFVLVRDALLHFSGQDTLDATNPALARLLGWFIVLQLFLTAAFHLTNLYATEHHGIEHFILAGGGVYTLLFWGGQVLAGCLVPLFLLFGAGAPAPRRLRTACALALAGGFAQLYVIIIAGQAYPQTLFPGRTVSSSFQDGEIARYAPTIWEWMLGLGGIALALLLVGILARILPFLPRTATRN